MLQIQACFPFQLLAKFKPPITILKVAPTTRGKQQRNLNLARKECFIHKRMGFVQEVTNKQATMCGQNQTRQTILPIKLNEE